MTSDHRRLHAQVDAYEDRIRRAARDVANLEAELEQLRRGDPVDETGRRERELVAGIEFLDRQIADCESELAQLRSRLTS